MADNAAFVVQQFRARLSRLGLDDLIEPLLPAAATYLSDDLLNHAIAARVPSLLNGYHATIAALLAGKNFEARVVRLVDHLVRIPEAERTAFIHEVIDSFLPLTLALWPAEAPQQSAE